MAPVHTHPTLIPAASWEIQDRAGLPRNFLQNTCPARPLLSVSYTNISFPAPSPLTHSLYAQHSEYVRSWGLQASRHLHRNDICWGWDRLLPSVYTPKCQKHFHIHLSNANLGLLISLCHYLNGVVGGLKTGTPIHVWHILEDDFRSWVISLGFVPWLICDSKWQLIEMFIQCFPGTPRKTVMLSVLSGTSVPVLLCEKLAPWGPSTPFLAQWRPWLGSVPTLSHYLKVPMLWRCDRSTYSF